VVPHYKMLGAQGAQVGSRSQIFWAHFIIFGVVSTCFDPFPPVGAWSIRTAGTRGGTLVRPLTPPATRWTTKELGDPRKSVLEHTPIKYIILVDVT
jgi:hypothetical protein